MNPRPSRILITLAAQALSIWLPLAQAAADPAAKDSNLPTAKEIIAKHVEAVGGRDAMLKQTVMRGTGKFEITGQGAAGDFEFLRTKPNKQVVRITIPAMGPITIGYDGRNGWIDMPGIGANLLEGKMLDQSRDEADFYNQLHDEKNFKSMETVGRAPFEGQDCYQVKLIWNSRREINEFYDAKTGLQASQRSTQETPQGSVSVTSRMSEYKKFGDLLFATKINQKMGDVEQVITINNFSYDPIPEKEFELPASLKQKVAPAAK